MAKIKMFTVYDVKAEAFLVPFFMRSTGEALRAFEAAVNDPSSAFCRHPGDFTLFELGEFEDNTGQFELFSVKKSLVCAIELKRPAGAGFNSSTPGNEPGFPDRTGRPVQLDLPKEA